MIYYKYNAHHNHSFFHSDLDKGCLPLPPDPSYLLLPLVVKLLQLLLLQVHHVFGTLGGRGRRFLGRRRLHLRNGVPASGACGA